MSPKNKAVAVPPVVLDPSKAAFTVPEASVYLALTCWQVRRAIWRGELVARRFGKSLVIRRQDADAFLAAIPPVQANSAEWFTKREGVVRP